MWKKSGIVAVVVMLLCVAVGPLAGTEASAGGGISYASLPDEVALYLNDMVFARDEVTLPGEAVRVLLPPGTYPDTLILKENGERVRNYRVTPQPADVYYSQATFRSGNSVSGGGGMAYILTWDSSNPLESRTVSLEYLMSGASWTPTYDMQVSDDVAEDGATEVNLGFFAEIQSSGLTLDGASVYLVAGRVDLSQQINQESQVMMNQYAVGYNETVDLPALGTGSVDMQHVYPLHNISVEPGDRLYANLAGSVLKARRLLVWNAAQDETVNVIYKVTNSTDIPFAQGIVRAYRDGLFLGSDYVETTPVGSEGSITVGHLPDIRVHRTASQEYKTGGDDYYQHTVTLEIHNFSENDLDLKILDRWEVRAWEFEYSLEPEREQDNLLTWTVTVRAGDQLVITYTFRTDA